MPDPGLMTDRITLERFVEGAQSINHGFQPVATVWAATEPSGDGRFRFSVWYRPDLPTTRGETEPAMRVEYPAGSGTYYQLDDVVETVRRTELQLTVSQRIGEDINHLRTGTRRIKTWP